MITDIAVFKCHKQSGTIPDRRETASAMIADELRYMKTRLKKFLRKMNHAYKNFIKNGMPDDKSSGMQQMVENGRRMIEEAKRNYFIKVGRMLANPETSEKTYWSLLNNVLHKARIPIIPPLLENKSFITDFTERLKYSMTISCFNVEQLTRAASYQTMHL